MGGLPWSRDLLAGRLLLVRDRFADHHHKASFSNSSRMFSHLAIPGTECFRFGNITPSIVVVSEASVTREKLRRLLVCLRIVVSHWFQAGKQDVRLQLPFADSFCLSSRAVLMYLMCLMPAHAVRTHTRTHTHAHAHTHTRTHITPVVVPWLLQLPQFCSQCERKMF